MINNHKHFSPYGGHHQWYIISSHVWFTTVYLLVCIGITIHTYVFYMFFYNFKVF
jgi:hypothetical protein